MSGPPSTRRRIAVAALAGWFAACSATTVRSPAVDLEPPRLWPAQSLLRVRYEGPAGKGGLRLVLRQVAEARFQLLASDALGRAAWSLELADDRVLMVNHRERLSCTAGSELRVPELALRQLPLVALPRVLHGLAPLPELDLAAGRSEWTDDAGQRWTVRREDGRLAGWTLWRSGEPRLWWTRQAKGGVLSHVDGAQFRWRLVTREELSPAGYPPVESPAGYPLEPCEPPVSEAG